MKSLTAGLVVTSAVLAFFLGSAIGYAAGSRGNASATLPQVITVTEQYDRGSRVTSGTPTVFSAGVQGYRWNLTYVSDGIFIDCKK